MPTHHALRAITGLRSSRAVSFLLEHLLDEQCLDKDAVGTLLPGTCFAGLAVLGTISAGFPSPAEEELTDTMSLDEYLITNKEATYGLRVTGDSMKDAGILPGDLLLVEREATPRDGDMVIAHVDHDWTMKYFRRRGRQVFLEAAHKEYKPIYPAEELQIAAVVRAVIRKYT